MQLEAIQASQRRVRHGFSVVGLAMLALACSVSLAAGGQVYDIDVLDALDGSGATATAINDLGQIVGESGTSGGELHAFLNDAGTVTDLGTLGGPFSTAQDINSGGVVVGTSLTSDGFIRGFVYENGQMTDLGTLGGDVSTAMAINDANQIVGAASTAGGAVHAVRWEKQGGVWVATDLGTLGGATAEAKEINENGVIVGVSANGMGFQRAFVFDAGVMSPLPTLDGDEAEAVSINDDGVIVGAAENADGVRLPVVWASSTSNPSILATFGGSTGTANAIAQDGSIAGVAALNGRDIAVLWADAGASARPVSSPSGFPAVANDMADSGVIVGSVRASGVGFATRWTPPTEVLIPISLGTLGGATSEANAINNVSQITGSSLDGQNRLRAFLWENGTMSDIGDLGGGAAVGNDINDNGIIVGFSANADGEVHAFRFNSNNMNIVDLGTLGGGRSTAHAINNQNVVVGESEDASSITQPFVFRQGAMTALPTPTSFGGVAFDINDNNVVVGWVFDSNFNQVPARWRDVSGTWRLTLLDDLGGGSGEALAIDNANQIVGTSLTGEAQFHAFYWKNNAIEDLGDAGGGASQANDIYDRELIVGEGRRPDNRIHALTFNNIEDSLQTLEDLVPFQLGWTLNRANSVNDSMQIVGSGRVNGQSRAFLIDPSASTVPVTLDSVSVTFGTVLAGGVPELMDSDDETFDMRSQFGFSAIEPNIIDFQVVATSPSATPSLLNLTIEARLNNAGGTGVARLRNFSTGVLDSILTYAIGTNEVTETALGVPASNYVRSSDGRIEVAQKFFVVATFSAAGFDSFVDQVAIEAIE